MIYQLWNTWLDTTKRYHCFDDRLLKLLWTKANSSMPKRKSQSDFDYPADLVWAVASAAYRINGGYVKWAETTSQRSNKEIVKELLQNPAELITEQDHAQGQLVRSYIAKTATMASLRGTLDTWGQEMARVSQLVTVENSYDLNVIASMPQTYERQLQRDQVHERLSAADRDYVATVGHKLELAVEVLENCYSRKWGTYYVTVIDTANRAWYFAYRSGLKKGEKVIIRGTVKRQADGMVQLNRVKLINGANSD
jgi:hypothetical protein